MNLLWESSGLVLYFSLLLRLSNASSVNPICNVDHTSLPRGPERSCKVYPNGLAWGTGCDKSDEDYYPTPECQAFIAMYVIIECEPVVQEDKTTGHTTRMFKSNQKKNDSGTLVIASAQLSDSGEYECRTTFSNGTSSSTFFNVSISSDTAIGVDKGFCNLQYIYNSTYNCCLNENGQELSVKLHKFGYLYAYGADDISVQQEWMTPASEHYHTDVGLTVIDFNQSSRYFVISIEDFPVFLSRARLDVMAIVTVTNSWGSSSSFCVPLYLSLSGEPKIGVNKTLPESTTTEEGGMTMFECLFYSDTSQCNSVHFLKYFHENNTDPVWHKFFQPCILDRDYSISYDNGSYTLNVSITKSGLSEKMYRYSFYILSANLQDNNSVVSCSIESSQQVQWERNATLLVYPRLLAPHKADSVRLPDIVVIVTITTTVLFIAAVVSCVLVFIRRRRKEYKHLEDDRVPLTNDFSHSQSFDSECGTPLSVGRQLPTLQIVEYNGPQRVGLTVLEAGREDLGYDSDHESPSLEELSSGTSNTVRPSSLTLSPTRALINSDADLDYTDPSASECIPGNPMVYISYTENKEDWVYDYLKPLLESWNSQVILHDEDMIPGFTISGERQRLILQAHRVVLVVSPDYSSSPWCLYELQHAITKEPVMFRGRIIPIMVDGCHTLPILVKGIVPLFDSAKNFELKLKKNICGTT